jgi:hypothetical protein
MFLFRAEKPRRDETAPYAGAFRRRPQLAEDVDRITLSYIFYDNSTRSRRA